MRISASTPLPHDNHSLLTKIFANQERWKACLATGEIAPEATHPRLFHHALVTASCSRRWGTICLHSDDALPGVLAACEWLHTQECDDAVVWSAVERPSLDRVLLAHGAQTNFQPWWMTRSLSDPLPPAPVGVTIRPATNGDLDDLLATDDMPYVEPGLRPLLADPTRDVTLLVGRDRSGIVGQAVVFRTGSIAGLYNIAVRPDVRRKGIGTALTIAACEVARGQSAARAILNATPMGAGVYRGVGFRHVGKGQTWFIPAHRLRDPADPAHIEIALKLVQGVIEGLDPAAIPTLMPNGERPMAFAAKSGNPDTLRWLLDRGLQPEILPLWTMGFRDEAMAAMQDPAIREQTTPPMHATPLHLATQRGDIELARLLIDAGGDLTIRDAEYRGTPLGWAEALGQPEIAAMIREAGGS